MVSPSASYTFTANAKRTLVANFRLLTYTISTSANPSAGGTTSGDGTYNCGSSVTVTATTNGGYLFVNWTEGSVVVCASPDYTFTASSNRTLEANFRSATLAEALNTPSWDWVTNGDTATWYPQTVVTHDGSLAAQSGAITHRQTTWIETTVTGPGIVSFWWKVSSETNYDYLRFFVGELQQTTISGEVGWVQTNFAVAAGPQTLRWAYHKDISMSMGSDAGWVDQVSFGPYTYLLSVSSANPSGGAAITVSPADNGSQGDGATPLTRTYNDRTVVALTAATVAGGNVFQKWQRDGVDWASTVSTTVSMDTNHTMTAVYVIPRVHYVAAASTNPVPPYISWATAARTIQEAVDAASVPGALVWVSNGVYASGGRAVSGTMTNRVAVDKPVTVRSTNGPTVTVIQGWQVPGTINGDGAVRCVYLSGGAVLSGFTLTNGATRASGAADQETSGGGVFCESSAATVTNCVLAGNSAHHQGGGAYAGTLNNCALAGNLANNYGGGAFNATLNHCTLTRNAAKNYGGGIYGGSLRNCLVAGNSAGYDGGGAYEGALNNCTLTGNSADGDGGGAYAATLNNCILYYNTASSEPNYNASSILNYCCATPGPGSGTGNITAQPLFVDRVNGNLRLQPNSPCINAGANSYVLGTTDLDGLPRIVGGTVDMGAYEFQTPGSIISYAWLQAFGLPTDGTADFSDPDRDGRNNWQEWVSGTDPTNALSVLRLLAPTNSLFGVTVSWQSVTNRAYSLERSTNLGSHPPFQPLATAIPGRAGTTTYTDTNPPSAGPIFYRVGAQP